MKKLLLFFILPAILPAQGVINLGVDFLYKTTTYETWVAVPTDSTFKTVTSTASADTFETRAVPVVAGGGDIAIDMRAINISGTLNAKIEIGIFRGAGLGTNGYDWQTLTTFTTDSETSVFLPNFSWAAERPFSQFKIRVSENGSQSNHYVFWVHHYRIR